MNIINEIKNIKINLGYDLLKNQNQPIPNLSHIKLTELEFLKNRTIDIILDNTYGTFISNSVEYFYQKKQKFVYPIVIFQNDIFETNLELSKYLILSLNERLANIVIFYLTEGYFGWGEKEYDWLNQLSKNYSLDKSQLSIITSNLNADKKSKEINFIIYPYPFFMNHIAWIVEKKLHPALNNYKKKYKEFLCNVNKKDFHFLCFNATPRVARLIIFAELMCNKKLVDKSILSLGASFAQDKNDFYNILNNVIIHSEYKNKNDILNFYKNYDSTKQTTYDMENIRVSGRKSSSALNHLAHKKTFLNIVTETLYENPNCVFFSEKIFKPIYMCQPFILIGCPNSLKILHEFGFKTFSKWWDESYDEELDYLRRINKIVEILENIASWDMEYCSKVSSEMGEILENNFHTMFNCGDKKLKELYLFLETHKAETKSTFI